MNDHVTILELLARGAAVGAFLGLALELARASAVPARLSGVLFCLAAAAHTLTQLPALEKAFGLAWAPIWALSVMGAGLFWAFALDLFEDYRVAGWRRFLPAAGLLTIGLVRLATPEPAENALTLAHNGVGAALAIHILFVIASGWRGDLVEPRRRLRGPVLVAAAGYALVVTVVESGEIFLGSADALSPLAAASLMAMGLVSLWAFGRVDVALFGPVSVPIDARNETPSTRVPSEDAKAAAALDRLMREERLYRTEGLTIASLALRMRMPEHKLRRLINQQLGQRNFNAFLNQWRLADAKAALADPGQRDVPISTIALDAGFASLGPFNRAFKADTDLTPSEFRARALASPAAAVKQTADIQLGSSEIG